MSSNAKGSLQILASNLLAYVVFKSLRTFLHGEVWQIFALAAGNVLLGLVLVKRLLFSVRAGGLSDRRARLSLLAWSLGYSVGYGAFLVSPDQVEVSGLLAIRSLSPFFAVTLAGRIYQTRLEGGWARRDLVPAGVLLLLICHQASSHGARGAASVPWTYLLIFISAVVSQLGARILSTLDATAAASAANSFLNGIFLLGLSVSYQFVHPSNEFASPPVFAVGVALLPPMIVLIQILFLRGLGSSTESAAAFASSASVVFGILLDRVLSPSNSVGEVDLLLACGYIICVSWFQWVALKPERTVSLGAAVNRTMNS